MNSKQDRKYDAFIQWNVEKRCNLDCVFCFSKDKHPKKYKKDSISLTSKSLKDILIKTSKTNITDLARGLKHKLMRKSGNAFTINIPALIRTLNHANKTFLISFSGGGEPFLVHNIVEACTKITRRHYIGINTNLTSKKFEEFCEKIEPERVMYIRASLHFKELERLNLLDRFINNFRLCKEKGFNIAATEVAYPSLLGEVESYKRFFKERGIELRFMFFLGEYNGKRYPNSYTEKEITTFGLDKPFIKSLYGRKGKKCNVGYNVSLVSVTGDAVGCTAIKMNLGNIYKKIEFRNTMVTCPVNFCSCPIFKEIE